MNAPFLQALCGTDRSRRAWKACSWERLLPRPRLLVQQVCNLAHCSALLSEPSCGRNRLLACSPRPLLHSRVSSSSLPSAKLSLRICSARLRLGTRLLVPGDVALFASLQDFSGIVPHHGVVELREACFACCSLCHFPVCIVHDAKIHHGDIWKVRASSAASSASSAARSAAASSASACWHFRGLCMPNCHVLAARAPERIISEPYLQGLLKGISRGPRGYVKKKP